ncbi:hypothetical protein MB901379_02940 [Mycobacterium basiliense]|uniref:Uncharacterized protein n=1 Tax=Mycobacterium basiliense TaxID=2094119 RepID=A0A447GFY9_9MYCO|nr:hypothetical protein MB901379_02940 [Mycobacterium basiliense]
MDMSGYVWWWTRKDALSHENYRNLPIFLTPPFGQTPISFRNLFET